MIMRSSSPTRMELEFELGAPDIYAFTKYTVYDTARGRRQLLYWRVAVFVFLILPFLAGAGSLVPGRTILISTVAALMVSLPGAWLLPLIIRSGAARLAGERQVADTKGLGHWLFVADPTGLHHDHVNGSGSVPWRSIDRIDSVRDGVYLFTTPRVAHIIPRSAFTDADEQARFVAFCEEMKAASDAGAGDPVDARSATDRPK